MKKNWEFGIRSQMITKEALAKRNKGTWRRDNIRFEGGRCRKF